MTQETSVTAANAKPFRIAVPDQTIEAIRDRVRAFRWDSLPEIVEQGDPWSAGASLPFMRELCAYWADGFDWRTQEEALNRFPQFMAEIDGQAIHFLYERGSGSHAIPLVLTHGWPGSVLEFLNVIDRFAHPQRFDGDAADGIDVIVPALPGFGFSGRPAAPVGPHHVAGLWEALSSC